MLHRTDIKFVQHILTVSLNAAMLSAVPMTVADRFLQCVRSNWLCVAFAESPMFVLSVFVRKFLGELSGRERFRFLQIFIKMLSLELNTFHFIVLGLVCTKYLEFNVAV